MKNETFLHITVIILTGICLFFSCTKENAETQKVEIAELIRQDNVSEMAEPTPVTPEETPSVQTAESLPQSLPSKYFTKEDYLDMILVEGGSMEIQGTEVTLDSFYMNRYELVDKISGEAKNWAVRNNKSDYEWGEVDYSGEELFILNYSIEDALICCNQLSLMEGLEPVYYKENGKEPILREEDMFEVTPTYGDDEKVKYFPFIINKEAIGYRLPTEAEWEFAARGGNKSKGYIYAGSNNIDEVAWYNENIQEHPFDTLPGTKLSNELEFYDMSGSVSEWCVNTWDDIVEKGGAITDIRVDALELSDYTPQTRIIGREGRAGIRLVRSVNTN